MLDEFAEALNQADAVYLAQIHGSAREVDHGDVKMCIRDRSLSEQEIRRSISKFNQYISERNRFLLADPDYIAKGYKPILTMNEGYADVAYEETPELIEAQKRAAINQRLNLINLPSTLKEASLAKVELDDKGRFEACLLYTSLLSAIW